MGHRTRTLLWSAVLAVGFASGARVAVGDEGLVALAGAGAPAPQTALRTRDPVRGSAWAPVGSTASFGAPDPRPVIWRPTHSTADVGAHLRARPWRSERVRMASLPR
jgi:hypothetical protein